MEASQPAPPPPWWRQVLGYTGVCVVEALFAAVLIYVYYGVLVPWAEGNGDMARLCGLCALIFLGPVLWIFMVVAFVLAKVAVVLIPHARRHWALAVYWGVTLALLGGDVIRGHFVRHAPLELKQLLLTSVGYVIAPLVLTLSHFLLIPRVAPGGSALDAIRALVRR